jgi:hypothetical protein
MMIMAAGKVLKTSEYRNGFTSAQTIAVTSRMRKRKRRKRRDRRKKWKSRK